MQNYTMKVSIGCQIFLQCSQKDTFVFTINLIKHGINHETVYQTVRLISQFSLEINIKYSILNVFTVLSYAVEVAVIMKKEVLDFLSKIVPRFPRCL